MKSRSRNLFSTALVLGCLLLLFAAASATAATRFAAPGGKGADPCANPAEPCSLHTAADEKAEGTTIRAGDEVVLSPGEYSNLTANDLGPQGRLVLPPGITLRGLISPAGERAVIDQEFSALTAPAIQVRAGDLVTQIHVISLGGPGIDMQGGIVERVLVETFKAETIACSQSGGGTLRNSVCVGRGFRGAGVGVNRLEQSQSPVNITARLRNVTARGTNGFGLRYIYGGDVQNLLHTYTVDARSVIAQGTGQPDVEAFAFGTRIQSGTHVRIALSNSSFDSKSEISDDPVVAETLAEVTAPGTNGNILAAPRFAADGFHQLSDSPTVNAGTVDQFSGARDFDGNLRTLGGAPDIGADEFAVNTDAVLLCDGDTIVVFQSVACTMTVVDSSANPTTPSGQVQFTSSGAGFFSNDGVCTLTTVGADRARCQIQYTPVAFRSGSHEIVASYGGDDRHEAGRIDRTITVARPTRFAAPGGTGADPCADPADPCSFFVAAATNAPGTTLEPGVEVILAPGEYKGSAGDLGPSGSFLALSDIRVHGQFGQPRPIVKLDRGTAGLEFRGGTLAHLEIVSNLAMANFRGHHTLIEDVISRSTGVGVPCVLLLGGLIRDSACLASGGGASALAAGGLIDGTDSLRLRNVTAIATGENSLGLDFTAAGLVVPPTLEVDAVAVLARGAAADVSAESVTAGATVDVTLDHSAYATTKQTPAPVGEGGSPATVTEPGSGTNIVARPLLAADGVHQLSVSPTIDAGAIDEQSGALDIDGERRTNGPAADIGADEMGTGALELTVTGPEPPKPPAPTPPRTTLKTKPKMRTAAREATFTFVSNQAGSRFECKLDENRFKLCHSPFKLRKLKRGRHVLRVRAVNPQGLVDPTPAVFEWKVGSSASA